MTTYAITSHVIDGYVVTRSTFLSTLTMTNPVVTGGGTIVITPGGPGSTTAAAIGYLWPRGDGTPNAT